MSTLTVHHAYNEVVAPHYDLDPQGVTGDSLDRAVQQLRRQHFLGDGSLSLNGPKQKVSGSVAGTAPTARGTTEPDPFLLRSVKVLDLGMGTGLFLSKLKAFGGNHILPFGLDLAENMIANARRKIPDLVAAVDDAANFDDHFSPQMFNCISTHFVTGFVPMDVLAPKIWNRLEEGGYWSFVGGTKEGFPGLRAKAHSKALRWLCGAGSQTVDDVLINPTDQAEVETTLQAHGFEVCEAETFQPELTFGDFDEFMEFGYHGGWFTPILESIGLHKAGLFTRWFLNQFVFPVNDHHSIAIVLARKVIGLRM